MDDDDDISFGVFFLIWSSGKKRHEISCIVAHKTPINIVWGVGLMLRTFRDQKKTKNLRVPRCDCVGGSTSHWSVFQENFVSGGCIGFVIVYYDMSEDGKMQYSKNTHRKAISKAESRKNVNKNWCNNDKFLLTDRFEGLAVGAVANGRTSWWPRKVWLRYTVLRQTCFGCKFLYCFIFIVGSWLRILRVHKFIFPLGRVMFGHHQSRYRFAGRTHKALVIFALTCGRTKLVSLMSYSGRDSMCLCFMGLKKISFSESLKEKFGSGSQMSCSFQSHRNTTFLTACTNILTFPQWERTFGVGQPSHYREGIGDGEEGA